MATPVHQSGRDTCFRICPGRSGSAPSSPPFWRFDADAVDARACPVDLLRTAQAVEQRVLEAWPDPSLGPGAPPSPTRHPRAIPEFLRHVLPPNAGVQHKEDAAEHRAVVEPRTATLRFGRLHW